MMIANETLDISVEEVVDYLRIKDVFLKATREVLQRKLAAAEANNVGIWVSDEELQEGADIFRASKNLYTVDETEHWMKRIGITTETFESYIKISLLVEKFKDHLEQELDTQVFLSDSDISERLRELKFQKWFDDKDKKG
jgi:hypothetical protein